MRIWFAILFLLTFSNYSYALNYDEAKEYEGEIVIVSYSDYGNIVTTIGKVILIFKDKEDFTFDNTNSIMIIFDYKKEIHNIRTSKIKNIKIYKEV